MSSTRSRSQRPTSTGTGVSPAAAGGERAIPRKRTAFMDAGRCVQATQAKNRFGAILKSVRQDGPVFIEKHGTAQAVVLDVEAYRALLLKSRTTPEAELDTLRAEFHELCAQMQTEKSRKAVESLFAAPVEKLNRPAASRPKSRP